MASMASDNEKLARARAAVGADYVPDDSEEYMNERQQEYFRMLSFVAAAIATYLMPSRSMRLRSILRARRTAAAFSRARFSLGFS